MGVMHHSMTYQKFQTAWLLCQGRQDVASLSKTCSPETCFTVSLSKQRLAGVVVQRKVADTYNAAPWKERRILRKMGTKKTK